MMIMKIKIDAMTKEQVREITFWNPITLEKSERILSYFKGRADKVGNRRIPCLDHVMAGIDCKRPDDEPRDIYFIKTQIGITQWVVDALKAGEKIPDFRLFYERKFNEHTNSNHFA